MTHRRMLAVVATVLILVGCRSSDEPILAEVEGKAVTESRFRTEYIDYLRSTGLPDEPSRRRAFLERMISMRLVVLEGREQGLDGTPEYAQFEETARRRLLVDAYLADAYFDSLTVSQTELEDMFIRVNTRVTARHLFAGTLDEAKRLETRLAAGETFEDLARKVFADTTLARNGGLVGTFGFDEMDPAFEEAAFSLKIGGISEPVRTAQGWSIIRVDDRFTQPVMTESEFAGRIQQLEAYVRVRRRAEIRRRLSEELEAGLEARFDQETLSALLAQITGITPAETTLPDESEIVRFRTSEGERVWTVADFREAARFTSDRQRASVRDRATFEAFATGLLVRQEMIDRALDLRLDRTERYRSALDDAASEWLYDRAYDRLSDRIEIAEDTLRAYFDRHATEFMIPEKIRVRELVVATRREADSLLMAARTTEFSELARRHSLRRGTAAAGGDLGLLSRDELGPWADRVFTSAAGEIAGPLEVRGQYLLLEAGPRTAAHPASFDEVRTDIESMLQRDLRRDFLRDHVASLRKRFRVRYSDAKPEDIPLQSPPIRTS